MAALHVRNGIFYIKRRVPKAFAQVDGRAYIWISLQTGSRREAEARSGLVWGTVMGSLRARLAGRLEDADKLYAQALEMAAGQTGQSSLFFSASPPRPVPNPSFSDIPEPILEIRPPAAPQPPAVPEVLPSDPGGTGMTVSEALKFYFKFKENELRDKSPDQLRRWRNPRIKAINNFIAVAGDKDLGDITADDMLDFRNWWIDRINEGGLDESSANKDFIHFGSVMLLTAEKKRLGITPPVRGYALKAKENKIGKAFSDGWIRTRLLAPGALDGLNPEARGILLGMINTGYRPSEGAALLPEHIHLHCDHPHIEIKPVGREVKSLNAIRYIPLAGVSLEAFRQHPGGFPRYRNSARLSATVNKYMRENGLLESDEHSMYSLRHSFQDRMVRAKLDPRLQADFMGHAFDRSRYGDGGGLAFKYEEMSKIAI